MFSSGKRSPHSAALLGILVLLFTSCALANTAVLNLGGAKKGTSKVPVTMRFTVSRSFDLAYPVVVSYHTVDGTALAGVDYTAAEASVVIPAGASSASIPVTLSANTSADPDLQFQVVVDGAAGIGSAPAFAGWQSFDAGKDARCIAVADLNGDAKADLATANYGNATISVLRNTTTPGGIPAFAGEQTFDTPANPSCVAASELNGDGRPDLIVTLLGTDAVSVLLNTTAPGDASVSFSGGGFETSHPVAVAATDVNGDGKADVVVANSVDDTVTVALNTTAPGATVPAFGTPLAFGAGNAANSVATADVNTDGKPDLVVGNNVDSTVSILINTTPPGAASPSFEPQQAFGTGDVVSVAATDVNGDGRPDLVTANQAGSISVLLNATTPGSAVAAFAPQRTFEAGTSPRFVATADLNGDGRSDVVVGSDGSAMAWVLANHTFPGAARPEFAEKQPFDTASFSQAVAAADLNGDGRIDLIAAGAVPSDAVSVLLNQTTPTAATLDFEPENFPVGRIPSGVVVADLNGDGKRDVATANAGISESVSVLLNTAASGADTPAFADLQDFDTGPQTKGVAATDINRDGRPDLVATVNDGYDVAVLLNTTAPGASTAGFAEKQTFDAGFAPTAVVAVDLNGDGRTDLAVGHDISAFGVAVLLNDTGPGASTAAFAAKQTFSMGDDMPVDKVVATDVNSDGKLDLVAPTSLRLNTTEPGASTLTFAAPQPFSAGDFPYAVAASDLNGDGKPDVVAVDGEGDTVSVLLNTTPPGATIATFATRQAFATEMHPRAVAVADVDGDGGPDLIVGNTVSNSISVLLNATVPGAIVPSFTAQQAFFAGGFVYAVAAGDLNGDGSPDLITANGNNRNVTVTLNRLFRAFVSVGSANGIIVHEYIFDDGFETGVP